MPAFDPTQPYEAVDAPQFDPSQPFEAVDEQPSAPVDQYAPQVADEGSMVREFSAEHPAVENAAQAFGETVSGLIPKTLGQAGELVTGAVAPMVQGVQDIAKTGQSLYDVLFGGKSIEETNAALRPEAAALSEVDQTPAYSKERFKAGFDVLAQMGMAAAVGKGLQPKPDLVEQLFGKGDVPVVEEALAPATAKAVEPVVKAGAEPPPVPAELRLPKDEGSFPGISQGAEDVRRAELNKQTQPVGVEPNASEITSSEGVSQPEVRTPVGEEAPLRQPGETAEARQGTEAQPVAQEGEVATAAPETVTEPVKPLQEAAAVEKPLPVEQKPSKIGKSIEAKAVEAKLTQGFEGTAGYDPITIKDQANRATGFIESSPTDARAVIRGDAPLPEGLRGTSLITAMEEQLLKKPDAKLAYELANSPLTSATSSAAQEMRLMAERVPDSLAAKFQEIRQARQAGSELRGETPERLFQDIRKEVVRQSSKRPTWEAFVKSITC